jgi:hypothetical protein
MYSDNPRPELLERFQAAQFRAFWHDSQPPSYDNGELQCEFK